MTPTKATRGKFAHLGGPAEEPPIAPRRGRPPTGKKHNTAFHSLTVYIPRDLHRQVKGRLFQEGKELSVFVTEAFAAYLAADNSSQQKSRKR